MTPFPCSTMNLFPVRSLENKARSVLPLSLVTYPCHMSSLGPLPHHPWQSCTLQRTITHLRTQRHMDARLGIKFWFVSSDFLTKLGFASNLFSAFHQSASTHSSFGPPTLTPQHCPVGTPATCSHHPPNSRNVFTHKLDEKSPVVPASKPPFSGIHLNERSVLFVD